MKTHPLPQMEYPHASVVQHLPGHGEARRRCTRLLIRRDERFPDAEDPAAVVAVMHAWSERAIRREDDRIVRRGACPLRPFLNALPAARRRKQKYEQNERTQISHRELLSLHLGTAKAAAAQRVSSSSSRSFRPFRHAPHAPGRQAEGMRDSSPSYAALGDRGSPPSAAKYTAHSQASLQKPRPR